MTPKHDPIVPPWVRRLLTDFRLRFFAALLLWAGAIIIDHYASMLGYHDLSMWAMIGALCPLLLMANEEAH